MQQITEQQILALAPNPAAGANGKKISQKGGFVRLEKSADDTFFLGECQGSGKSNYITTADFVEPDAPVFRCSCPSRQFPCKHSLALLYEIMAGKSFKDCEIPEDILKKREKKRLKEEKAAQAENPASQTDKGDDTTSKPEGKSVSAAKSAKSGAAARTRQRKKQLEGLALTEKMVRELLDAGLGTMGGATLSTYKELSKQLGDYYLPGPQRLLNRLILEIEAFQEDQREVHYEKALAVLEKLWALVKKSTAYLQEKLENKEEELDASPLYEELGGVWKLSELEALGSSRKDAHLLQLAFWVEYEEARREYIDIGCWLDMDTGEICLSCNYRPVKALKYVKQEDSLFGAVSISSMQIYPGEGTRRVRWEHGTVAEVTKEQLATVRTFAAESVAAEAKAAKNYLKNAMSAPVLYRLIAFEQIGRIGETPVLADKNGATIYLGDCPDKEPTLQRLRLLTDRKLLENQVLLGGFYYDAVSKRLLFWPLSIVTEEGIVRLLY